LSENVLREDPNPKELRSTFRKLNCHPQLIALPGEGTPEGLLYRTGGKDSSGCAVNAELQAEDCVWKRLHVVVPDERCLELAVCQPRGRDRRRTGRGRLRQDHGRYSDKQHQGGNRAHSASS
jgi:hypothetical protein